MSHVRVHVRATGAGRVTCRSLGENGVGPSGGRVVKRAIFNHRGRGQARWAFRAWGSGGDGIYRMHTPRAIGAGGWRIRPPVNDRSKIHA